MIFTSKLNRFILYVLKLVRKIKCISNQYLWLYGSKESKYTLLVRHIFCSDRHSISTDDDYMTQVITLNVKQKYRPNRII